MPGARRDQPRKPLIRALTPYEDLCCRIGRRLP